MEKTEREKREDKFLNLPENIKMMSLEEYSTYSNCGRQNIYKKIWKDTLPGNAIAKKVGDHYVMFVKID